MAVAVCMGRELTPRSPILKRGEVSDTSGLEAFTGGAEIPTRDTETRPVKNEADGRHVAMTLTRRQGLWCGGRWPGRDKSDGLPTSALQDVSQQRLSKCFAELTVHDIISVLILILNFKSGSP